MGLKLSIAALLLALCAGCGAGELSGQAAPPFKGRSLDGKTFTNASLKGKVVLIQFWATWCGFCRRDQPAVEEVVKRFAGRDLTILAVSVGETKETVREYLAKSKRSCTVVATEDTDLTDVFPTRGFPTYLVLDKEGNIAGAHEGAAGLEGLKELLAKAGLAVSGRDFQSRNLTTTDWGMALPGTGSRRLVLYFS